MHARAHDLADRFDEARGAVVDTIASYSEEQLRTFCEPEQCTVAALACHVGLAHALVAGWVEAIVAGQPLPELTMAMVDAANAKTARQYANASREEALALLRRNGDAASALVRGLSDEQLDHEASFSLFGGTPVTPAMLIDLVLIGDPRQHLPSIRSAAEALVTR